MIKVADEVWVATALLHRQYPDETDFTVGEIVERAKMENVTGNPLRPGVQVHAYLHCVANKPPNPGRYRMLVETAPGRRRLFRSGDICDPARRLGKEIPRIEDIPSPYGELLDWYHRVYVRNGAEGATDPLLSLRGLGKEIWADEGADEYVERLRAGWR